MVWAQIAGAVISAIMAKKAADKQAQAAKKAASAITASTDEAQGQLRDLFGQTQAEYQPYQQMGAQAGSQLSSLLGGDMSQFYASPDYQFRLGEGQKAIERGAAARGGLLSGRTLKDLQRFGQGLASQEYGDYWKRINDLYTTGLGATQALGAQRSQTGTSLADLMTGGASAKAGGIVGAANARASGYEAIGSAASNVLGNQQFQNTMTDWWTKMNAPKTPTTYRA